MEESIEKQLLTELERIRARIESMGASPLYFGVIVNTGIAENMVRACESLQRAERLLEGENRKSL